MTLIVIMLWSVSLFLINDSSNQEKVGIYRANWQTQLDHLQKVQKFKLKQFFHEVSEGVAQHTKPQQRLHFINQYYQSYPELRLIQIEQITKGEKAAKNEVSDCQYMFNQFDTVLNPTIPIEINCLSNAQPMMAISAEIDPLTHQKLVLLMDYFSFIKDFEIVSGKHFYSRATVSERYNFKDNEIDSETLQVIFKFSQGALTLGSLTVAVPVKDFSTVWAQQAKWFLPSLLFFVFMLYLALSHAIINPLLLITRRIRKAVLTRRPGNAYDNQHLTPGLMLLHKFCMHLTFLTKRDPLTGLNNRAVFEEHLQQAILEGKRSGRKFALVLLDVNHFYKVNKKYGNYLGDGLLKQLAARLTDGIRESDSLARLEKDNFAILLEFSDQNQVTTLVEKLYQSLATPYTVYGRSINIGISIGVAIYPDHAQNMEGLEIKGNEALLKAHRGDWPVVFTQQRTDSTDYSGLSLIQSLRQALENNDFKLVYQPVMDLKNHNTSYFEALLRWKDPEMHSKSIEKTIELAEKNQLIKPLSQWIINTACKQLKEMSDCPVKVAVNLSMMDFHDETLPENIGKTLEHHGVSPDRLMIEITEGQFMQEPEVVIEILNRLSSMGISLSIDDFGTGQASLTYLKKLPVEKLKIDQSFVKDMVSDEEDSAIVEATIKLAHTLDIEVVAEGVESAEIHALLMQMDCDFAQGYYISRPIEEEFIPNWIIDQGQTTGSPSVN